MVTLAEHNRTTITALQLYRSGQTDASPQWKTHESPLGICEKSTKGFQTVRNKILWYDETKIELFVLNSKRHVWRKSGTGPIPPHQWSMVVVASCCWSVFQRQGLGDCSGLRESWASTEISLRKTWSRVLRTSDWAKGSPSNRTMTLSTVKTMQEWLMDKSVKVLEWPSQSPEWTQSNISGETWKWQSTDGPHSTWQICRQYHKIL